MIQILVVDDHPAMRAGLVGVLTAEPGIVPLDAIASGEELQAALRRCRPGVVLLDYHLPGDDGLMLCRQIKRTIAPPAVLIYSAYADADLAIPAVLAGADGLLHKGVTAPELYDAIRAVAQGRTVLPPIPPSLVQAVAAGLDPEDLPVLMMRLSGTPVHELAAALRTEPSEISHRIDRMLGRLRVRIPTPND
jgi:DNA-binding NarL/FixJ family response regulator